MKIIVDAFGGDNAPLSNVSGAADAVRELGAEVILVGDEEKLQKCAKDNSIELDGIEIVHAPDVMDIHDDPNTILKSNKNTSLAVALTLLKEGKGDAVVSAGSTGAILFGATFIVKRMKGIKRPALATECPQPADRLCCLIAVQTLTAVLKCFISSVCLVLYIWKMLWALKIRQ